MIVWGAGLTLCFFFVIVGKGVAKSFKLKPKTGPEALIGLEAEVVKTLNPSGQVRIKREIWLAESLDKKTIPKKLRVEIVRVEGNTLFVELKAQSSKFKAQNHNFLSFLFKGRHFLFN